jgi:hypothetical protein
VIDHKAVGCVIAGQYPKFVACLSPAADIAKAEVVFNATVVEGVPNPPAHKYTVPFKAEAPCFAAILPKPSKKMKEMVYHVHATDRQFREGQTADNRVRVVADKGGCDKDMPVAGWVPNASVIVGAPVGAPAVPIGFGGVVGGGIGAGTIVVGSVLAGGATAATLVATSGGDGGGSSGPTATPTPPAGAPTATPPPPPTATPTPPPIVTAPPPQQFKAIISVFPKFGSDPLLVAFDCCASQGTNLRYEYDFDGDGVEDARGVCRTQRTYTLKGTSFAPLLTTTPTQTKDYFAKVTVREALADGNRITETHQITVEGPLGLQVNSVRPSEASRRVSWTTDLGGSSTATGQVVVNGSTSVYARAGRSHGTAAGRPGVNRVEMQLVQGGGPGQVTFDLRSMPSLVPGSLRVIAGDVAAVTDSAITFRLKGASGERVVFTVEAAE